MLDPKRPNYANDVKCAIENLDHNSRVHSDKIECTHAAVSKLATQLEGLRSEVAELQKFKASCFIPTPFVSLENYLTPIIKMAGTPFRHGSASTDWCSPETPRGGAEEISELRHELGEQFKRRDEQRKAHALAQTKLNDQHQKLNGKLRQEVTALRELVADAFRKGYDAARLK